MKKTVIDGVLAGMAGPSIFWTPPSYVPPVSKQPALSSIGGDFRRVGNDIRHAMQQYRLGNDIEKAKTK